MLIAEALGQIEGAIDDLRDTNHDRFQHIGKKVKALGRMIVGVDVVEGQKKEARVGTNPVEEKDEWMGTSRSAGGPDEMEVDEEREWAKQSEEELEEERKNRKVDYKNKVDLL